MIDYSIMGWTCIIDDRSFIERLGHYKEFKQLEDSQYKILNDDLIINIRNGTAYLWRSDKSITQEEIKKFINGVMRK